MKKISILGSTGSIGLSTLDVVRANSQKFKVVGLAEGHDVKALAAQIGEFSPEIVSVRDEKSAAELRSILSGKIPEIRFGIDGACDVARVEGAEMVVSAIVGAAGLKPTVAAIENGKKLALANKESMVVAGPLVSKLAKKNAVEIIPIDSEHSAIFQSMVGHRAKDIDRVILTASGGPFLRKSAQEIENATPAAALKHPRWSMGAKITIDSASLMNKGLEVIEAKWLFDLPVEKIAVVVHPQSIIHSMVEYVDGCVIAELGVPDMRAPIAYAISYPERTVSGVERLNLAAIRELSFEDPDLSRFPCLSLAFDAIGEGGSMPAVLNAANEIAVDAFLKERIPFGGIPRVVSETMNKFTASDFSSIDEILEIDRAARKSAEEIIAKR